MEAAIIDSDPSSIHIGSVYMHAFKRMYLETKYPMSIQFGPCYSELCLTIVAQSSVIQGEFALERKFHCFSDDKWVLPIL